MIAIRYRTYRRNATYRTLNRGVFEYPYKCEYPSGLVATHKKIEFFKSFLAIDYSKKEPIHPLKTSRFSYKTRAEGKNLLRK